MRSKKILAFCMTLILLVGVITVQPGIRALANAEEDEYQADIEVQVQNADGSVNAINNSVDSKAVLKATNESVTVFITAADVNFIFENFDGSYSSEIEEAVVDGATGVESITYRVAVTDISNRIASKLISENGEEEVYLVLILGDDAAEVLDNLKNAGDIETEDAAEPAIDENDSENTENTESEEQTADEVVIADKNAEAEVELEVEAEEAGDETDAEEAEAEEAEAEETQDEALNLSLIAVEFSSLSLYSSDQLESTDSEENSSLLALAASSVTPAVLTADNSTPTYTLTNTTASSLADGEYSINIEGREMDSDSVHRQSSNLVNPAKIIVSGDSMEFYFSSLGRELTFQTSSGSFENRTVSTDDGSGEIRSDGYDTSTVRNYKMNISSTSEEFVVKFPAGGSEDGYLTYRVVLLADTLTEVNVTQSSDDDSNSDDAGSTGSTDSSGSTNSTSTGTTSSSSSNAPKTGDTASVGFFVILLMGASIVLKKVLFAGKKC
ncbi:MAG: sortase B protein-sorting domain-containing protein [Lachnospiraceae bacterium]